MIHHETCPNPHCGYCEHTFVPDYGDATARFCGPCVRNYSFVDAAEVALLAALAHRADRREKGAL